MTCPPASPGKCITSPPELFRLAGPSAALDPRTHAFRNDLADIALAGSRFAPHYARAEATSCHAASAMVMAAPSADAQAVSQLVRGEGFALLDRTGEWGWGRCLHDDYVGYVRADALGPVETPGWQVVVPLALAFAHGNIKATVMASFPLGARLAGVAAGEFVRVGGCFIHRRHLARLDQPAPDWVAVAERLVGLPYLWGGRGAGGIDCSGLVQVALGLAGTAAPRDSDQQRDSLGALLPENAPLQRGDLVFLPGHVGIMLDEIRLLHANAFWMAVTIEPLADALARAPGAPVTRRRIAQ